MTSLCSTISDNWTERDERFLNKTYESPAHLRCYEHQAVVWIDQFLWRVLRILHVEIVRFLIRGKA